MQNLLEISLTSMALLWLDFQVYYSEETHILSVETIEGKCEVRKKNDIPAYGPSIFQHIFFCEHMYDPSNGSLKKVKLSVATFI